MSASNSAFDSALWFRQPAITTVGPYQAVKQTFAVVILYITMPAQDRLSALQLRRERTEATRVIPIRDEAERGSRKICKQTANPNGSWVHAAIYTLLAGCCAITFFSVCQAPFRILPNGTDAVKSGVEIAALPAGLTTQSTSHRVHGRQQNAGEEAAGNSVGDALHKRKPSHERAFQQKQSRRCIQAGQLAQRK